MNLLLRSFVGTLTVLCVFGLVAANGTPALGPHLQPQFRVGKLPNVTWTIGRQYAGNLPVQRGTNLSLFFWGVESKPGSLTAPVGRNKAPWNIWLNGSVALSVLINSTFAFSLSDSELTSFSFTVDPDHRAWSVLCTRCVQSGPSLFTSHLTAVDQNGPIRLNANYTASENTYSWDKQADTFWIDQPV